jgi:hypothetical protein
MDEKLRDEILGLSDRHTEVFSALPVLAALKREADGETPHPGDEEHLLRMRVVDEETMVSLRSIVREHGWPRRGVVGLAAAIAGAQLLFLLLPREAAEFQRECLARLREAFEAGEASRYELANLTDRVLLGEGRPQRYGTQLIRGPGGLAPEPIEDPDRVDEVRASIGLGSLAEWLRRAEAQARQRDLEWRRIGALPGPE